jgi:hypothetical protein
VRVTNFVGQAGGQLRLFEPGETKLGKLDRTVDALRERFGSEAIQRASLLKRDT